jgi:ABC-2 type transport system permease protein
VIGALHVYRRELAGLFLRPLAWVLLVIALAFLGLIMSLFVVPLVGGDVDQVVIVNAGGGTHYLFLLALLPPLVTMRMISEEARSGLLEFLLTAPVRDLSVVLGKLGAATTFMAVLWGAAPLYALCMEWLGTQPGGGPDWAPVWTGYLGSVLASGFFCAVGLAVSAATATPLVAGFLSFVINLVLMFFLPYFGGIAHLAPDHWLRWVLVHANVVAQLQGSFMLGVLDTRALAFFAIWTAFFAFLATRLLEMRRWR